MSNSKDYENAITLTIVDSFFSICKIVEHKHPFVNAEIAAGRIKDVLYKEPCVYIWYNNETEEFYIGSGDRNIRKNKHVSFLRRGVHWNYKFRIAYKRNPNFKFYYLPVKDNKEALALEQILIDMFWGNHLFLNISRYVTAPMAGRKHSEETKRKIGLSSIGNKHSIGRKASPETRAKLSIARLGNTNTLGFKQPIETRMKKSKPVIINGTWYYGGQAASDATGMCISEINRRVRSDKHTNYQYAS